MQMDKNESFWALGAGAAGLCQRTADFKQRAAEPAVTIGEVRPRHLQQGRQRRGQQ